jgi:hypothetical protein
MIADDQNERYQHHIDCEVDQTGYANRGERNPPWNKHGSGQCPKSDCGQHRREDALGVVVEGAVPGNRPVDLAPLDESDRCDHGCCCRSADGQNGDYWSDRNTDHRATRHLHWERLSDQREGGPVRDSAPAAEPGRQLPQGERSGHNDDGRRDDGHQEQLQRSRQPVRLSLVLALGTPGLGPSRPGAPLLERTDACPPSNDDGEQCQ